MFFKVNKFCQTFLNFYRSSHDKKSFMLNIIFISPQTLPLLLFFKYTLIQHNVYSTQKLIKGFQLCFSQSVDIVYVYLQIFIMKYIFILLKDTNRSLSKNQWKCHSSCGTCQYKNNIINIIQQVTFREKGTGLQKQHKEHSK